MNQLEPRTLAILISAVVTLLVASTSAAYFVGYTVKDSEDRSREIQQLRAAITEVKRESKEYTDLEVGGLRADWERDRK